MPNEPVVTANGIAAFINALMVMAVALGWVDLAETQQAAIMGVVVIASPVVASLIARRFVTPV